MSARCCQRGEPVVRAVLEAALDELARVGYGALTFEDVAARAGVNKTTVYRRWATKPALVKAALTAAADAAAPLHETGDLRCDLLAVARRARDAMSSPRGRGLLRMLLGGCMDPELIALSFGLRKQVEAPARRVIERALQRGDLQAGIDPELVLYTISGWILHMLLREHATIADESLSALVELVVQGAARGRAVKRHAAASSRSASSASGQASSTARGSRRRATSAKSAMPSSPVVT